MLNFMCLLFLGQACTVLNDEERIQGGSLTSSEATFHSNDPPSNLSGMNQGCLQPVDVQISTHFCSAAAARAGQCPSSLTLPVYDYRGYLDMPSIAETTIDQMLSCCRKHEHIRKGSTCCMCLRCQIHME